MSDDKVTEEKVTEEEGTEGKIYQVDSGKLVKLHALLKECVSLARETVVGEFGDLAVVKGSSMGHLTTDLAVALFNKASVPDQTETMLAALERGLEWYGARDEEQKAESAKIDQAFKMSIQDIVPPRRMAPVERLVRSLLDFATSYTEVELKKLSDQVEEAREIVTGGEVPTPEE